MMPQSELNHIRESVLCFILINKGTLTSDPWKHKAMSVKMKCAVAAIEFCTLL